MGLNGDYDSVEIVVENMVEDLSTCDAVGALFYALTETFLCRSF